MVSEYVEELGSNVDRAVSQIGYFIKPNGKVSTIEFLEKNLRSGREETLVTGTPDPGNVAIWNSDGGLDGTVGGGGGEINTASNQGAGGVGLYDTKVGADLQFRNVNTLSSRLTVALDAGNKEVDLDVAETAVDHDNLLNYVAGQHRVINDAGTSATELWSASKVDTELGGKADTAHTHAASDIDSGTLDDARVAQSNVTQHEAALDHDALANYAVGQHRTINDVGTGVTDLWSASKIDSELALKAASVHTHAAADVTSGTLADARISSSSVTQHINDAGTGTTDLWSADKIATEIAAGGGAPAFHYVQLADTSSQNINAAATDNLVTWNTQDHIDGDSFSHTTGLNPSRVTFDVTGKYEIMVLLNLSGSATRYNGRVKLRIDGTTTLRPRGKSGYIRNTTGHAESSLTIPGYIYEATAGEYVEVLVDRESTNTSTVALTSESVFQIKRLS